jgi:hypothetical protein
MSKGWWDKPTIVNQRQGPMEGNSEPGNGTPCRVVRVCSAG